MLAYSTYAPLWDLQASDLQWPCLLLCVQCAGAAAGYTRTGFHPDGLLLICSMQSPACSTLAPLQAL
jgi:hypothetical protein